jgi:hypothetical protein
MGRGRDAALLAERLCRPHRIGLFGHRGVGKTTLLTALYRAAVSGRLPDLRLAAADVPTANYLSDKVPALERGDTLPATLAETALHFHLYHGPRRLDLLVRDYQGEHVELGRHGSIQEFLRECDAVWLCLDVSPTPDHAARLRRQQEIEHLLEDYLTCEPRPTLERPMALLLTKADVLGSVPSNLDELAAQHFGITRHALQVHCPRNGLFAVSSLGSLGAEADCWVKSLAEPLAWLTETLQSLDESRAERLWSLAGNRLGLLDRCVTCFAQRYPDAPATAAFQRRLAELHGRRRRRWSLAGLASAACLVAGMWTYDAAGYQQALQVETEHPEAPATVLANWQQYEAWHPTRHWTTLSAEHEAQRNDALAQRVHEQERDRRLAQLRVQAADPDADAVAVWRRYGEFRTAFPEVSIESDLAQLRLAIKARRDEQVNQQAQKALDELQRAAEGSNDLTGLIRRADAFLSEYPGTSSESEARRWRDALVFRLDERDIQEARTYSARQPVNFQTRREHYQRYLERHPAGGAFTKEAETALRTIAADWDKHDFRAVRDHFVGRPGDLKGLAAHCRRYLAVHTEGKFRKSASELLRWSERVGAPGEYRVVLRNGQFEKSVGRWFSKGPKLSVELEVNGIRYGPSTICYNRYDPEWDYEFPRRIRWKMGDAIVIRVTEHSWSDRLVVEIASDENDPLSLRLLAGEVSAGGHWLKFESDFALPVLPKIE